MKSAAIVTLPGMFNYGNMLQKYAVQSLLKKAGAIPVTFEFRDRSVVSRLKNTYYKLTGKWIPSPESLMSDERRTRFKMFAELACRFRRLLRRKRPGLESELHRFLSISFPTLCAKRPAHGSICQLRG